MIRKRLLLNCLLVNFLVGSTYANTEKPTTTLLEIAPNKCVALREGLTCHAKAEFSWQSAEPISVCLYNKITEAQLNCWEGKRSGRIDIEISAKQTVEFELRAIQDQYVYAYAMMQVAWVYQKKRRPVSWRLF